MFSDEDLFTISITAANSSAGAGRNVKRGEDQETQTDPLQISDKETTTLQATESVEIQVDTHEGQNLVELTDEQYNADELEGFLRARFRYISNSLKEYSVLQSSKSSLHLTRLLGNRSKTNNPDSFAICRQNQHRKLGSKK